MARLIFSLLFCYAPLVGATYSDLDIYVSRVRSYMHRTLLLPESKQGRPLDIRISDKISFDGFTRPYDPFAASDLVEIRPDLSSGDLQLALVHELAHVLRHSYNSDETSWLDEGIAKLIEVKYSGVWAVRYQDRVHRSLVISLSANIRDFSPGSYNYVSSYFFVQYLYNKFGGDHLLRRLVKSPQTGWNNILSSIHDLSKKGIVRIPIEYLNAQSIWRHFAASVYFNDAYMVPYSLFFLDSRYSAVQECAAEITIGSADRESIYFGKQLISSNFDVVYGATKSPPKIEREDSTKTYDCLIGIIYPK